ncbi:MAG: SecDF P1 head subdomain-containing protein, partial [Limisphaerales bacterium]
DKSSRKHPLSTFRLYQEMKSDPMGRTEDVSVFRDHPITMTIDKAPFLTEANIEHAQVINDLGGFALSIQFDHQGSWLLEQYTSANRGKHILVFSQFVNPNDDKLNKGRWLAAPKIQTHIADGLLIFTPDASREEADQVALGLNNVAKRLETGQDVKW